MWAAANDASERHRRRSRLEKLRRGIIQVSHAAGVHDDKERLSNKDSSRKSDDSSSDSESEGSDDERSTTESVHDVDQDVAQATEPLRGDVSTTDQIATQEGMRNSHKKKRRINGDTDKKRKKNKAKKKKKRKQVREETPEATMARLTSSYSVAMEAVGALHRVSRRYCDLWKEREASRESQSRGNDAVVGEVMDDKGFQQGLLEKFRGEQERIELEDNLEENNAELAECDAGSKRKRNESTDDIDTGMDIDAGNQVDIEGEAIDLFNENGVREMEKENMNDLEKVRVNTSGGDANRLDGKIKTTRDAIYSISNAARTAMEQSLLLDPFIQAPILKGNIGSKRTHPPLNGNTNAARKSSTPSNKASSDPHFVHSLSSDQMTSACRTVWSSNGCIATAKTCLTKWNRLSAAHHTVLKQIAYLSLVNYADLLLCGCACHRSQDKMLLGTLDRGAVKILGALNLFSSFESGSVSLLQTGESNATIPTSAVKDEKPMKRHSTCCLWKNEPRERTIRLALACYCDASELDGTDPTLWFKMACAARFLGREVDSASWSSSSMISPMKRQLNTKSGIGLPKSYRGLERLALERGMSSIPPGVPPNRTLLKALREMEEWNNWCDIINRGNYASAGVEASSSTTDKNDFIELVINLPNYSWLTLGKILLRACREGAGYGQSSPALSHAWSTVSC